MANIECVPNFSEGRDADTIEAIREAIASTKGAHVLDVSSDHSHNRTVITFVADKTVVVSAALAAMRVARDRIDLTKHEGAHPRIGATDVVPFIPLGGATIDDCIALARELGQRAFTELGVPVYLYERAATLPTRENLADVRRGQFEGLREEVRINPARKPDFGNAELHATAGATAVGARPFLVAYNVYLGDKSNIAVAKAVAKAVRGSSGGLRYVKGLGLEVDGQAQVSMNLVDTEQTPMHRVFETVKNEAAAHGVAVTWSEIVGLVPERVLLDAGARHVQLRGFSKDMLLEHRVRAVAEAGAGSGNDAGTANGSVDAFLADVASASPTPGGGSVAALAGALGAALSVMVAGLTVGKKRYAAVEPEMKELAARGRALQSQLRGLVDRDASAYDGVRAAYALPKGDTAAGDGRSEAIQNALLFAAQIPLETALACAGVAELAAIVAERGNSNAVTDAASAALLAEAACKSARLNVRINLASLAIPSTAGVPSPDAAAAPQLPRLHELRERCAHIYAALVDALHRCGTHARVAERAAEQSIIEAARG